MSQHDYFQNDAPEPEESARATGLPARMARLLGAWRARRGAAAEVLPERDGDDFEQPPVEWALRLMM